MNPFSFSFCLLPACLPAYLPACLPARLSACLPACPSTCLHLLHHPGRRCGSEKKKNTQHRLSSPQHATSTEKSKQPLNFPEGEKSRRVQSPVPVARENRPYDEDQFHAVEVHCKKKGKNHVMYVRRRDCKCKDYFHGKLIFLKITSQ